MSANMMNRSWESIREGMLDERFDVERKWQNLPGLQLEYRGFQYKAMKKSAMSTAYRGSRKALTLSDTVDRSWQSSLLDCR